MLPDLPGWGTLPNGNGPCPCHKVHFIADHAALAHCIDAPPARSVPSLLAAAARAAGPCSCCAARKEQQHAKHDYAHETHRAQYRGGSRGNSVTRQRYVHKTAAAAVIGPRWIQLLLQYVAVIPEDSYAKAIHIFLGKRKVLDEID
jgi:hypothetical protein